MSNNEGEIFDKEIENPTMIAPDLVYDANTSLSSRFENGMSNLTINSRNEATNLQINNHSNEVNQSVSQTQSKVNHMLKIYIFPYFLMIF